MNGRRSNKNKKKKKKKRKSYFYKKMFEKGLQNRRGTQKNRGEAGESLATRSLSPFFFFFFLL